MRVFYLGLIRIWSVGFCGGRKTGELWEKPSEQELNLATWVETSALTTTPSLLSKIQFKVSRLKSKGYKSDIYFIKKKTNNKTYLTQIHSLCKWPAIFMKKEIPNNLFAGIHLDQMQTRTTFQLKRNNIVWTEYVRIAHLLARLLILHTNCDTVLSISFPRSSIKEYHLDDNLLILANLPEWYLSKKKENSGTYLYINSTPFGLLLQHLSSSSVPGLLLSVFGCITGKQEEIQVNLLKECVEMSLLGK